MLQLMVYYNGSASKCKKFIDWLSQYGALHTLKAVNICLCQQLLFQLQNFIE